MKVYWRIRFGSSGSHCRKWGGPKRKEDRKVWIVTSRVRFRDSHASTASQQILIVVRLIYVDVAIHSFMSRYETLRAEKIARNKALLKQLELGKTKSVISPSTQRSAKKRKVEKVKQEPVRVSARIASVQTRPSYAKQNKPEPQRAAKSRSRTKEEPAFSEASTIPSNVDGIRKGWASWKATAEPPIRDENGTFHFSSDPDFLPNKSPAEMLQEGVFGGSYFRPIFSSQLKITIKGDWRELPHDWLSNLNVEKFLTSPTYDPEVNKYGVACGQSIEEWEANGWINHQFDIRGWFQWYTRYFQGRRCDDDDRQISRWRRCVGETGRWKRALLKKYQQAGIRTVNDEGLEETEGVSPAIHQTCLHWALEIKQDDLDQWWDNN
jgi:hypothetical protein